METRERPNFVRAETGERLTRRGFLLGLLAAAGGGILAACAPGREPAEPFAGEYNTATPDRVLASPRAATSEPSPGAPEATATPEGEQMVATFVDALAWKVLSFTKPNTICASPGFWEERPEVTTIARMTA